jgi:hypothetical protein
MLRNGGSYWVSSDEYSCRVTVHRSPSKLWRSNSIFNLCATQNNTITKRVSFGTYCSNFDGKFTKCVQSKDDIYECAASAGASVQHTPLTRKEECKREVAGTARGAAVVYQHGPGRP